MTAFCLYGMLVFFVLLVYMRTGIRFSLFNIYFALFLLYYGPAFFIYNASMKLIERGYAIDTAYMLSLFVLGYFAGRLIFAEVKGKKLVYRTNYRNWMTKLPREGVRLKTGLLYGLLGVSAIIVFLGLFFYGGITSLITLMRNPLADAELIKMLRQNSGVSGWIAPFYVYVNSGIGRLLAFVFIGLALKRKHIGMTVLAFGFAMLLSISYLANMSKSSFVVFYCQLLFFLLLYYNVRIDFKRMLLYVVLTIPLLVAVYLITTGAKDTGAALDLIASRIFSEPIRVLELYPRYYPDILQHTHGMNIRLIHDLFGSEKYVPAHVAVTGGLDHASFNAMFIADAYVDFSFLGVLFQSIFVGYLLSYLDFLVFRRNNFLQKALMAALLIGIFSLINVGLITSLFGFGLITIPLLSYFLKLRKHRGVFVEAPESDHTKQLKVI